MAKRTTEDHIESYLTYLTDPDSLIDPATVTKAEAAVARAKNPIAKLKALTALDRARTVNTDELRAGFVAHASTWATEADVSIAALTAYGVPHDVLVDAGLAKASTNGHRTTRPRRTKKAVVARNAALATEDLLASIPVDVDFTVADAASFFGRGTQTARNYLNRLADDGHILQLGPAPAWPGPGRSPILFRRA